MENELFDEMYKVETTHWWFVARRRIIDSVMKKLELGKDSHILDVGCGNGDNLALLSKYGDIVAMERDDNAISRARSRNIGKVIKGELPDNISNEINMKNDLIVMLDVLEHIDNDAECLTVLRSHTVDNGLMLITVPAYQLLWSEHDESHHHERRYTARHLKEVIENNGWKIEYISYFNTFLFPLAFIYRIKQKIFPSEKDRGVKMPPKFMNSFFEKIFSFESRLIGRFSFPFGLSIMVVAKKT